MLAVILAAGRGTRLLPLTRHRSKAMMPVAGQPMVARVMEILSKGGAKSFIVVAHPSDHGLPAYLARSHWGGKCQIVDQEQRLGMVHALECAAPLVRETGPAEFLLASCDNLYPPGHVSRLVAHHRRSNLDVALTLLWTSRDKATASAVVVVQDSLVVDIIEKPKPRQIPLYGTRDDALTAPSLYALCSDVLDYLDEVDPSPRGEREIPGLLRRVIAHGGRVGGQTVSRRRTLTRPQDLLALNRHMLRADPTCATADARMPADTTIVPPVRIESGATVASGCLIGPEAYLESGCRVGRGATVRRSVVLTDGYAKPNSLVEKSVVSSVGTVR